MDENSPVRNRIEWIDIAKGLGMILVVVGHSGIPNILSAWIWSFHMPLFFFVSGIVFTASKYITLKAFLENRFRTLILPYFLFSIIVYLWAIQLNYHLLIVSFSELYLGWNGIALWFIPVLFFTETCFFLLNSHLKFKVYKYVIIFLLSSVGYIFYLNSFHLPFKIEVVCYALFFYGIGSLSKKSIIQFTTFKSIYFLLLTPFLFVASLYISLVNRPNLDMAFNIIGNYILTTIGAFVGIAFLFAIALIVSKTSIRTVEFKKIATFIGRNTFIILAFHQVVLITLKKVFENYVLPKTLNICFRQLLMWTVLVGMIYLFNNYFPFILKSRKE